MTRSDDPSLPAPKKSYHRPHLVRYGPIQGLTAGGSMMMKETTMMMTTLSMGTPFP